MDEKILNALDKLIEKYSKDSMQSTSPNDCPFCVLYWDYDCKGCPNNYFKKVKGFFGLGCVDRSSHYYWLAYHDFKFYSILKKFWTRYKELYLEGKENDEIMETLLQEFLQIPVFVRTSLIFSAYLILKI